MKLRRKIFFNNLESIEDKSLRLTSDYILSPIADGVIYVENSPIGSVAKNNRGFKRVKSIVIPVEELLRYKINK